MLPVPLHVPCVSASAEGTAQSRIAIARTAELTIAKDAFIEGPIRSAEGFMVYLLFFISNFTKNTNLHQD
jgi:hypothetical protein